MYVEVHNLASTNSPQLRKLLKRSILLMEEFLHQLSLVVFHIISQGFSTISGGWE